jgi:hypothetical protein
MRTRRSIRRQKTQVAIRKKKEILKLYFSDPKEIPTGNKLSKFSLSCKCSACSCARYYGKKERRELENRIADDRFRDQTMDLEVSKILTH